MIDINDRVAKYMEITDAYSNEKHQGMPKKEFLGLQVSVVAGVGRGGRDAATARQDFKNAVMARQTLQEKRDSLFASIEAATTVEELESISWT